MHESLEFPILKIGSHGEDVRKWQKFLIVEQKILLDPESMALDGIYGPGTTLGTKTYQANKSLPANGIVDSDTLSQAIEDDFNPSIDV
jgi:hypothetical protein